MNERVKQEIGLIGLLCRYVEEYFMSDVERELGLTRDRLAELALLLGSDYTEVSASSVTVFGLCKRSQT
jgi:hypothetical protein